MRVSSGSPQEEAMFAKYVYCISRSDAAYPSKGVPTHALKPACQSCRSVSVISPIFCAHAVSMPHTAGVHFSVASSRGQAELSGWDGETTLATDTEARLHDDMPGTHTRSNACTHWISCTLATASSHDVMYCAEADPASTRNTNAVQAARPCILAGT